jgi:hypothetical protein
MSLLDSAAGADRARGGRVRASQRLTSSGLDDATDVGVAV